MPGKNVTVTVPSSIATAGSATLHIGGWTDKLYAKTLWKRLPDVVKFFSISSTSVNIVSAYGGLIYLTLPTGLSLGSISVTVTGERVKP